MTSNKTLNYKKVLYYPHECVGYVTQANRKWM